MSERATAKRTDAKVQPAISGAHLTDLSRPDNSVVGDVLRLQKSIGNQATQRLLNSGMIQFKSISTGGNTRIRRTPIVREGQAVSQYEYTGREQRRTTQQVSMGTVNLSYDPDTGVFLCTFPLKWRFPPSWGRDQRNQYMESFASTVSAAWSNRFSLTENVANGRTAQVRVAFNNTIVPDFPSDADYVRWLVAQPPDVSRRWTMEVSSREIREELRSPVLDLDPSSMVSQARDVARYRNYGRPASGATIDESNMQDVLNPPYSHYEREEIRIRTPSQRRFSQTPAVHEFGHMIGLSDEYVISREDYMRMEGAQSGEERAVTELRRRSAVTGNVMNIGSQINADHYRPFAEWLSSLTGTEWRVGAGH